MTSKRDPNSTPSDVPAPDNHSGSADSYDPSPAQILLASHIEGKPQLKTLFIHSGPEILARGLTERLSGGQITWMDRDQAALSRTQDALRNYPEIQSQINFEVDLPQETYGSFDQAAIIIPKGRGLARRWILAAYLALKPAGNLYLAGPNNLGIRSLIQDAEMIFSATTILAYKKGNRIARLRKPVDASGYPTGPDWLSEPGIAPETWQEFQFDWQGSTRHFYSLPGVFSSERLDEGTRLLLDTIQLPQGASVLDFGCGCGVIGILAALSGAASVDLVDIDLLAVASTRKNLASYQITDARCLAGDGFLPVADQRYTHILSNPPFHAGRPISYQVTDDLIASSGRLLEKGGRLVLVANRFIPYEASLQRYYHKVSRLAETGRFHVLAAWNPK